MVQVIQADSPALCTGDRNLVAKDTLVGAAGVG